MARSALAPKTCEICGNHWMPQTRYQAARNLTCSKACKDRLIGSRNAGRPSPFNQRVMITCAVCGATKAVPQAWLKRVAKPTCSRHCNGILRSKELVKHSGNMKGRKGTPQYGPSNPAWKGGATYRNRHGNYVSVRYVRCPPHLISMARKDGYVMEHRLVMAEWIGRPLTRAETVHHLDHQPLNNPRSNLELWPTNKDHKLAEFGRYVEGVANRLYLMDSAQP